MLTTLADTTTSAYFSPESTSPHVTVQRGKFKRKCITIRCDKYVNGVKRREVSLTKSEKSNEF